jgi:hypothetical protein
MGQNRVLQLVRLVGRQLGHKMEQQFPARHEDADSQLVFAFRTPWAPPLPVLAELLRMWPQLQFAFKGCDEFESSSRPRSHK